MDKKYCDDFLEGQRDCILGNPSRWDASEAYLDGYCAQYEYDQIQSELTENMENGFIFRPKQAAYH